jgi:hypothetical protein
VYDGDTATFNINTNIGIHQWKVRFSGYDAPEIRTRNDLEKIHGMACRNILIELIQDKHCILVCNAWDKYGRLLADVYVRPVEDNDRVVVTESCTESDFETKREKGVVTEGVFEHGEGMEGIERREEEDGEEERGEEGGKEKETEKKRKSGSKGVVDVLGDLLHVNTWMLRYTTCVDYKGGTKPLFQNKKSIFHPYYMHHVHW